MNGYKLKLNKDNTYTIIKDHIIDNKYKVSYILKPNFKEKEDAETFIKQRESRNEM